MDCGAGAGCRSSGPARPPYPPRRDCAGMSTRINALFGDGSVRHIRHSLNLTLFNNSGHPSDRAVMNLSDL